MGLLTWGFSLSTAIVVVDLPALSETREALKQNDLRPAVDMPRSKASRPS